MTQQSSGEKITQLVEELRSGASGVESVKDLETMLATVRDLKAHVGDMAVVLRKAFDSEEWRKRPKRKGSFKGRSGNSSISDALHKSTERTVNRLENLLKSSQLRLDEIAELEGALESLLPVYRLGTEIFTEHEEIDQIIRDVCEDIGQLFENRIGDMKG